jgi:hypothetical protein
MFRKPLAVLIVIGCCLTVTPAGAGKDGDLATVWAPYDFHRNVQFSHCGTDAFDLLRTADGWRLTGGAYTVETESCPECPLGPPAVAKQPTGGPAE